MTWFQLVKYQVGGASLQLSSLTLLEFQEQAGSFHFICYLTFVHLILGIELKAIHLLHKHLINELHQHHSS